MENNEKSKWIPCDLAQPVWNGRYLVTCKGIRSAVIRVYRNGWESIQPVTHWQPLPRAAHKEERKG